MAVEVHHCIVRSKLYSFVIVLNSSVEFDEWFIDKDILRLRLTSPPSSSRQTNSAAQTHHTVPKQASHSFAQSSNIVIDFMGYKKGFKRTQDISAVVPDSEINVFVAELEKQYLAYIRKVLSFFNDENSAPSKNAYMVHSTTDNNFNASRFAN